MSEYERAMAWIKSNATEGLVHDGIAEVVFTYSGGPIVRIVKGVTPMTQECVRRETYAQVIRYHEEMSIVYRQALAELPECRVSDRSEKPGAKGEDL